MKTFMCNICGKGKVSGLTEKGAKTHNTRMHGGSATFTTVDGEPNVAPEPSTVVEKVQGLEMAPLVIPAVEKTPTPAPTPAPIVAMPPVAAPLAAPLAVVPVGSRIILDGPVWWEDPATRAWISQVASSLTVDVVHKELNAGRVSLFCRAPGGRATWSVLEEEVISGKFRVVSTPVLEPVTAPPVITQPEKIPAPDTRDEDRAEFLTHLKPYVEARDASLTAGKVFKKAQREHKEPVESFVRKYGVQSEEGKQDFVVYELGQKVHLVRVPGGTSVVRDEDTILAWVSAHGLAAECTRVVLDPSKWDMLKARGDVPADFISKVESMSEIQDSFRLCIDPVKSSKE